MKKLNEEEELARLDAMRQFEKKLKSEGYKLIAGVDEVGRGPLAGPVLACAAILPDDCRIFGINDSKKLSESKREELSLLIKDQALAYGIGMVDEKEIDRINILQATLAAMAEAVKNLSPQPDALLIDAVSLTKVRIKQLSIVKGDELSISVAAASIVAKVARDDIMRSFDKLYPEYGFASHKGYGTRQHIEAIQRHGLCPIHRVSFCRKFAAGLA
jgi:ribonuclease HII